MKLRPGAAVILEGLDRAGKTTQREAIQALPWKDPEPLITHMPSGVADLTRLIYQATEEHAITSDLARQLLHLACHAENLPELIRARGKRAVVIDRWWWSTVAYGWFGKLASSLNEAAFFGMINMVWGGFSVDVVFLFLTAFEDDAHNLPSVTEGYRWLARRNPRITVEVPAATPRATTDFMINELERRGLLNG